MMMNTNHNQLTDVLAFARSAVRLIQAILMPAAQPALVKVPVPVIARSRQVSSVSCDRGYGAFAGIAANAAVRMHADPVTQGWRSPDFGKTQTGNPGHSQPSRFAT